MLRATATTAGARREGASADTDTSRELGTACSEEKRAPAPTAAGQADGNCAQSHPAARRGATPAQGVIADSRQLLAANPNAACSCPAHPVAGTWCHHGTRKGGHWHPPNPFGERPKHARASALRARQHVPVRIVSLECMEPTLSSITRV